MTIFLIEDSAHGKNNIYQSGSNGLTISDEILTNLQRIPKINDSEEIYIIGEGITYNHKKDKFLIEGEIDTKETFIMKLIDGLYGALFVKSNRKILLPRIKEIYLIFNYKSGDYSISDDNFIMIKNIIGQLLENMDKIDDEHGERGEFAIKSYDLFGELCVNTQNTLSDGNVRKNIIKYNIIPLYTELYTRVLQGGQLGESKELFSLQNKLYDNTLWLRDTCVFERAKKYESLGKSVVIVFGSNHSSHYILRGAEIINDKIIVGGFNYKSKYLKYKQKYLELKNNLNNRVY